METNSKIIKYKAEHNWLPYMFVEARHKLAFIVTFLEKLLLEELVDQDARFGKAMHYHLDPEIHS